MQVRPYSDNEYGMHISISIKFFFINITTLYKVKLKPFTIFKLNKKSEFNKIWKFLNINYWKKSGILNNN